MDKRYQVFVSSTYADLKEERRRVIQTLMEMDCIPAGMELLPAADEEQWKFIKRVLDDCDYYVLIIGGRYGSLTPEGISYAEREYDYAVERDLPVIAFVHEGPHEVLPGRSEGQPELRAKLDAFREKVRAGRLVKTWKSAGELPGLLALSLPKTIKTYPAVGWVRASSVPEAEVLTELNDARKNLAELERELERVRAQLRAQAPVTDVAPLETVITVRGTSGWKTKTTFGQVFALLSPHLLEQPTDASVQAILGQALFQLGGGALGQTAYLVNEDFQTIKVQFMALGLVSVQLLPATKDTMALFWGLTERGQREMLALRAIRAPRTSA
jgi:hypothetical protein